MSPFGKIGSTKVGVYKQPNGTVNLFKDAPGPTGIGAFRHDYPGEVGNRNGLRGPDFAGLDMGLSKRWSIGESKAVEFRWEVFNVPNLKRFDVQTLREY